MHEAALARAAQPATAVVLGTRLRVYSLGHELLLSSRPDLDLSRYEDLEHIVLICCQTWAEYSSPEFWAGLKARLWRWRTWQWRLPVMRERIQEEARKFIAYRTEGSLEFPLSEIARAGRNLTGVRWPGAPFFLRLHHFLTAHLGKSESQAWDYPFGLAKMHWAAFYEGEGSLDIYNAHDAEFDRFCAEEDALASGKEAANG